MFRSTTTLAAALALGLGFGAMAQTAPQTFSDEKLEVFAQKVVEIGEIRADYAPRIESAANVDEQQSLIQQATMAMVEAVEADEDLTVEEYNLIAEASATDPDLAEKVAALVQDAAR